MRLLVTGGAGFMGSNFIRFILSKHKEYEVVNLDKLTYAGNLDNLKDIEGNPRYTFVKGDIADPKIVAEVVPGVDAILNYAAETHVDRSIMWARDFAITDVIGTLTLLEAVNTYKIPVMVQISTDEVFGSTEKGVFTEESPFLPNSPYSASKAGGDLMCRAFLKTYSTPVIVTHSVNFYGPYQYPEKVIPLFVTNLIEGKKVPLYGKGLNRRQWIYTEDHCRAVDVILHKGVAGKVYNITTGDEISNIELTKQILGELGKDETSIEYVKDRPGHDFRYALTIDRLRDLGWSPETSFTEGVKKTVSWYRDNEWWWKKLKDAKYQEYYSKQYTER
ncbi:MAG: dTDP-glucose 4,6-dehydratase [Parcubacteria group bacterium]